MADDVVSNATNRFSVLVPKPKARMNIGKPDPGATDGEAFGYTGMSLQSSVHFFIDVNKVTLFQSGNHACHQAGGKWLQWSAGPMWSSSEGHHTVTAGRKMLVVAGAGQGPDMALPHGLDHVTPRVVEYNNLELHYVVDEVHNGLKSFFYGSGTDWHTAEKDEQKTQTSNSGKTYVKGFLKEYQELLTELGYGEQACLKMLQPLEWEGDYLDMRFKRSSVYGAFRSFDPYAPAPFAGPISKVYAGFCQFVNGMHRFVDVLKAIGPALFNSPVGKPVVNLIKVWENSQEGFNSALNVADFARYDRNTGKTTDGWAWSDETQQMRDRLPQDSAETRAELVSSSGPYDISKISSPIMKVRSAPGGAQTDVDFTPYLAGTKATATLSLSSDIRRVSVKATADGDLVLDGAAVAYHHASSTWGSLPTGFAWAPANTAVNKTDGSAFTASGDGGVAVADQTFQAGEVLAVIIDDVSYSIDLTLLNLDSSGSTRADKLRAAINAAHAGAASGSVTVTSDRVGPTANVKCFPEGAIATKLGISAPVSEVGSGGGIVTTAQLQSAIDGKGTYDAAVAGSTVKVDHSTKGTSSYLEFSGGPTTVFFGADPAKAQGTGGFFNNFAAARSLEYEIAKWPEDVRNLARPVYEAFSDVSAVIDRIKGVIDSITMLGDGGPPKMLGLLAKDGISLGTSGSIYESGKNVTIVAAPEGQVDTRKFVPLIERPIHWLLDFDLGKLIAAKMKPKKKPHHAKDGDVRVVAEHLINLAAKVGVKVHAVEHASIESKAVSVRGVKAVELVACEGAVRLQGKLVNVGDSAKHKKIEATEHINIAAVDSIQLTVKKARIALDDDKISLGMKMKKSLHIDEKKPNVVIDDEKVSVGFTKGGKTFGITTEKSGDVSALAKSEFKIGAGSSGITVGHGEVALAGKLKVGSALLVNGDGVFTAPAVTSINKTNARMVSLPIDYAAKVGTATTQQTAVKAAEKMVQTVGEALDALIDPIVSHAVRNHLKKLKKKVKTLKADLEKTHVEWLALIEEARSLEMTDADLGKQPAHEKLFE